MGRSILFEWRWALASERGPHPTTRHVLLTLSLHMNAGGGSCYPSVRTLAQETGLNKDTVTARLQEAVDARWLMRRRRAGHGRGWRLTEYFPHFPEGVRGGRTASGGVVSEEVGQQAGEGVRNDPVKVSEEVGQSTTRNSTKKDMSGFDAKVEAIFERCCTLREERLGKVPGPPLQLTKARRSKISARLREGFTVKDLGDAASGFYADTWKERDKHLDPTHCFKDDEKVRTWMAAHRDGAGTRPASVQEAEWLRE